jgi:hypothetical protein
MGLQKMKPLTISALLHFDANSFLRELKILHLFQSLLKSLL